MDALSRKLSIARPASPRCSCFHAEHPAVSWARPADVGVAVALVPGDALGAQTRPAASGPLDRALVEERLGVAALVALPRTDDERHRLAATLGADVQLRGQATARPTEGLPRLGVVESGPIGRPRRVLVWMQRAEFASTSYRQRLS
jgi:hypothetical protein